MKKIGIYGGTFSPPHIGHVGAAESFSRTVELDKLLIMPDYLPPHKEFDGEATELDRLKMCELAFSEIDKAEVSDLEIKRGGRSYTSVTLEELSAPDTELYFLCGTDMFLTLGEWYRPERIFELATICYVRRESSAEADRLIAKRTQEYISKYKARIIPVSTSVREVSSSELRAALKSGGNVSDLISPAVYEYIVDGGLYQ